ncbi:MAG: hypothetical protein WCI05_05865 [Myxococcales bacterium]
MSSNAVLAPDVISTVEEAAHRTTALLEGTAHEIADAARAAHDALVAAAVEPLHRLADSAHALAQAETQLAHEADEARTRILEHVQSDAVDAAGHTARSALEGHIPVAKQLIAPAEHAAEEVKEHLRAAEGELVQNLQSLLVHEVQATQHVVSGMAHEVESSAHTLEAALLQAAEGGLGSVEEHHKARAGEVVAAGEEAVRRIHEYERQGCDALHRAGEARAEALDAAARRLRAELEDALHGELQNVFAELSSSSRSTLDTVLDRRDTGVRLLHQRLTDGETQLQELGTHTRDAVVQMGMNALNDAARSGELHLGALGDQGEQLVKEVFGIGERFVSDLVGTGQSLIGSLLHGVTSILGNLVGQVTGLVGEIEHTADSKLHELRGAFDQHTRELEQAAQQAASDLHS